MTIRTIAISILGIASAVSFTAAAPPARTHVTASQWTIGPVIAGRNYSRGMPLHPLPRPGGGWQVELPQAPRSLHYLTFRHGSLAGKSRIVMRYRIEAAPGVRIVPRTSRSAPSMITLYFQRAGDDWSASGRTETYRWFAGFATQSPVTPGDHVISARLDGNWAAVMSSTARTNPAAFRAAIANADAVGFVLGGGDGLGHGVQATGAARLIVTNFRVE